MAAELSSNGSPRAATPASKNAVPWRWDQVVKEVYFGFNPQALLIRVKFGAARLALADFDILHIGFAEPAGCEILVDKLADLKATARLLKPPKSTDVPPSETATCLQLGMDQIMELAVPFEPLGVPVDGPIQFFVELLQGRQSRDRAPREGTINLTCPSPDFEQIMWDV